MGHGITMRHGFLQWRHKHDMRIQVATGLSQRCDLFCFCDARIEPRTLPMLGKCSIYYQATLLVQGQQLNDIGQDFSIDSHDQVKARPNPRAVLSCIQWF